MTKLQTNCLASADTLIQLTEAKLKVLGKYYRQVRQSYDQTCHELRQLKEHRTKLADKLTTGEKPKENPSG